MTPENFQKLMLRQKKSNALIGKLLENIKANKKEIESLLGVFKGSAS